MGDLTEGKTRTNFKNVMKSTPPIKGPGGPATTENSVMKKILRALGSRLDTRLFRNNVGVGFMGTVVKEDPPVVSLRNYRRIRYGLTVGSADIIGLRSVVVTPEMVGKQIGVFISIECKTEKGVIREEQINWRDMVNNMGGIAIVARSEDEAKLKIDNRVWNLGVTE